MKSGGSLMVTSDVDFKAYTHLICADCVQGFVLDAQNQTKDKMSIAQSGSLLSPQAVVEQGGTDC